MVPNCWYCAFKRWLDPTYHNSNARYPHENYTTRFFLTAFERQLDMRYPLLYIGSSLTNPRLILLVGGSHALAACRFSFLLF